MVLKSNCLFILILLCAFCHGQDGLESLIESYQTEEDPTVRFEIAQQIAKDGSRNNPASSFEYARNALQIAQNLKNDSLICRAYLTIGTVSIKRDSLTSIEALHQGLNVAEEIENEELLAVAYNNLGIFYKTFGAYEKATKHYFEAITINKLVDNENLLVDNYQNLGAVFDLSGKFDQSLFYLNQALRLDSSSINNQQYSRIYNSLGIVYCRMDSLDNGVQAMKKALEYLPEDRLYQRSNTLNNIALAYQLQNNYRNALIYNRKAETIAKQLNDSTLLIKTMVSSIDLLLNDDNIKEATVVSNQGLELAKKIKSKKFEVSFLEAKVKIAKMIKDYKDAVRIQEQLVVTQKELTNEKVLTNIDEIEAKYQGQIKDQEIEDAKLALEASQLARHRQLLLSILLILAGIIISIFYASRQKLRARLQGKEQQLLRQKIQDLEKQKDIAALHAMMTGQEEERKRVAKDLHDGISGLLSTAKMYLGKKESNLEFQKGTELIDRAAEDVRRIAHDMMPSSLQKLGLIRSVEELAQDFQSSTAINFEILHVGHFERLSAEKETSLYRMIQEVFQNIIKHSKAREVLLQLGYQEKEIHLTIEDDGIGFDQEAAKNENGLGLRSIESRIRYLRGTLEIDSQKGKGTAIYINIPR